MGASDSQERVYDRALALAVRHYGQRMRKDGATPMLLHALRVVEILRRVGNVTDDTVLAGALLHDIMEETLIKREELEAAVGDEVTRLVVHLTDDRRLRKAERKKQMLEGFQSLPREAKLIKLADRLDNVRDAWLRSSDIWERYAAETAAILDASRGVCPPLEKAMARSLTPDAAGC